MGENINNVSDDYPKKIIIITYELVWLPKLITSTKNEDKIYGKNKHLINIFFFFFEAI